MSWREISPEQMYSLREPLIVDVRSPGEHAAEYIPGSINVPLLSDDERVVVGTIYKQEGELRARRLALNLISPKIPAMVDEILGHRKAGQTIVVHCWRGGLRSEAVSSFLAIVGVDCWRLIGGYKEWRHFILKQFEEDQYQFHPIVIDGRTGVGKSEILSALASMNEQVLDLESLANHRGSAFGGLGLGTQPTQKNFEAYLWMELRNFEPGCVFMEAESRKIGKIGLPDFLMKKLAHGRRILVTGSVASRVERIYRQYLGPAGDGSSNGDCNRGEENSCSELLIDAVKRLVNIKERLGAKRLAELEELAKDRQYRTAIELLLIHYYDPLYDKQIKQHEPYELTVDGDDTTAAATTIANWSRTAAYKS